MADLAGFLEYMGIDEPDNMIERNAQRALDAADRIVSAAVGWSVNSDPRFTELVYIYAEDLYSNRGVSGKVSGATRRLVQHMELQLQLEDRQYPSSTPLKDILTGGEDFC